MALAVTVLDGRLHDRDSFKCGVAALDDYLYLRAGPHQRDGTATTHVLVDDAQPARILGYCSLSAAQVRLSERRGNKRHPIPAVRVGRLAVSESGKGYGQLLVGHALNLALSLRQAMGVRVLVVDAKDEPAVRFYEAFGFCRTDSATRTLYLPVGRDGSVGKRRDNRLP